MKINERKHKVYFFVVAMFFLAIASPTQVYGFANSRILDGQEVLSENSGILGQRNTRDLSNPPNNLEVFNSDGTIERVWIPSTAFIDPSIVMPFQVPSFYTVSNLRYEKICSQPTQLYANFFGIFNWKQYEVITLNESVRSPNQSVIITIIALRVLR